MYSIWVFVEQGRGAIDAFSFFPISFLRYCIVYVEENLSTRILPLFCLYNNIKMCCVFFAPIYCRHTRGENKRPGSGMRSGAFIQVQPVQNLYIVALQQSYYTTLKHTSALYWLASCMPVHRSYVLHDQKPAFDVTKHPLFSNQ